MGYTLEDHYESMAQKAIDKWRNYLIENSMLKGHLGAEDELLEAIIEVLKSEVRCVKDHMQSENKTLIGIHGREYKGEE